MNEIRQYLAKTTTNYKNKLDFVVKQLKKAPAGYLSEDFRDGKAYFLQNFYENGRRRRIGLNNNAPLRAQLVRKAVYEAQAEALRANLRAMEQLAAALVDETADEAVNDLKQRCPHLGAEFIEEAMRPRAESEWATNYDQFDFRPEEKKHVTSRGLKVRSKSEVLIAEKLYEYGLEFRYEAVLRLGDASVAPDFTVRRADGKIVYWEHQGLNSNDIYRQRQARKAQQYAAFGIVQWDNLIVTYDDYDGNIDLRAVEAEIRIKLLV